MEMYCQFGFVCVQNDLLNLLAVPKYFICDYLIENTLAVSVTGPS